VKNLKTGIMRNKHTHEDGTPFTKEEFLQKLKTDKEFNDEFGNKGIDQISELIKQLKETPDSRRMVVNAWAVHDLPNMVLPPCHYGFQVYTRELSLDERLRLVNYDKEKFNSIDEWITWYNNEPNEFYYMGINYTKDTALTDLGVPTRAISLIWNQRSVDTFLGLPFNIASYGLLLTILAKEVNMVPDQLIGNLGDTHLYLNHIEQAKEQITREPFDLPTLNQFPIYQGTKPGIESYVVSDFTLKDYQSHSSIKAPLSN
jgi:thymidylate synthase